jgi:3-oxoacyl-[acyl-carrier-protein] synthase III
MGGIVDFDVSFPESTVKVADMSAACGVPVEDILKITHCAEFPVLGEREQVWELALDAARSVFKRVSVPLADVRYVIYAGSGQWDLPFWSPAAKIAHELGVDRAHCFEVTNFCNASMTAVQIACDRIELGRAEYALVLAGDRLSRMLDYSDADAKDLFNFGDAGAAVLVSGADYAFRLRHAAMRTDASWSDYYTGEHKADRIVIRRNGYRAGLTAAYVDNFTELAGETLAAVGATMSDVAYLLINHGDRRMHERLLDVLGLPAERTVFNYDRLGHMGSADTLIALRELMTRGSLRTGDLILLATSAMGFSWGITALEYTGGTNR